MAPETTATPKPKNKGGRPKNPIDLSSPEAQAAIAAAAKIALEQAIPSLIAQARAQTGDQMLMSARGDGATTEIMQTLAMAISEISDQGTNRKRVAPEILAAQATARTKMIERIIEAKRSNEQPEYRLMSKVYLNERLIEPYRVDSDKKVVPVEIVWDGPPNEAMVPLNAPAREIHELFMKSIGGTTVLAKTGDGRSFAEKPGDISVTHNGLVIKGVANARRTVGHLADSGAGFPDNVGVKGSNPYDPTATHVHVLGTVQPAARQNAVGREAQ